MQRGKNVTGRCGPERVCLQQVFELGEISQSRSDWQLIVSILW